MSKLPTSQNDTTLGKLTKSQLTLRTLVFSLGLVGVIIATQGCGDGFQAERHTSLTLASESQNTAVSPDNAPVSDVSAGDAPDSDTRNLTVVDHSLGNSISISGSHLPLYKVSTTCTQKMNKSPKALAFQRTSQGVKIYTHQGELIHAINLEADAYMFGGFDFDQDGCVDLGFVRSEDSGQKCGTHKMLLTRIQFLSSRTGQLYSPVSPLNSLCWNFNNSPAYPTHQWSNLSVLFGASSNKIALVPYYATQGYFFGFQSGNFYTDSTFIYPSTVAYDQTYLNDKKNAYRQNQSYTSHPHVANGLILPVNGEDRLVFFTSSRVVQYKVGPQNAYQLVADTPYLTAGRTDLVGRNYGRVQQDPYFKNHLILVSGASTQSYFADIQKSAMGQGCADLSCLNDPWGALERHISTYNLSTTEVSDRYFSYSRDSNDGYKYEKRIVFANNGIVKTGVGPSRIAFNEYRGGRWHLHITEPGSTADKYALLDVFLWDIQDLNGDGVDEWIISPTRDPSDPNTAGWYYPKWRTSIYNWDESAKTLKQIQTMTNALPHLMPHFRDAVSSTSYSFQYPVNFVRTADSIRLLMMTPDAPQKIVEREVNF
jgi:hypothetical protein